MSIAQLTKQLSELVKARSDLTTSDRYTLFPIQEPWSYAAFKAQEGNFWTNNEMDFSQDRRDYEQLPERQRRILDLIFAFFASADGVVCGNITHRFLLEAETLEQKMFYIAQLYIEVVHSESYSLFIDTLVSDPEKKRRMFQAADNLPCVKAKTEWMERFTFSDRPMPELVVAYACAEGIFFIASFLFIFWFRSKGLFKNVVFLNEQIAKDESLHRDFGCRLYQNLVQRMSPEQREMITDEKVQSIVREAVELEHQFVDQVIPEPIEELNPIDIKNFVSFLGDHLLTWLGHKPFWGIKSETIPTWMNDLSLTQKGNFYEVGIGNYKHSQGNNMDRNEDAGRSYEDPDAIDF